MIVIVLINMKFLRFMSVNQGQFIPVLKTLDSVSRDSVHYFHFKLTYFNIYTEIIHFSIIYFKTLKKGLSITSFMDNVCFFDGFLFVINKGWNIKKQNLYI